MNICKIFVLLEKNCHSIQQTLKQQPQQQPQYNNTLYTTLTTLPYKTKKERKLKANLINE